MTMMVVSATFLLNVDVFGQCSSCNIGVGCGSGASATGACSFAQGFNASASNIYSVAIGPLSDASGNRGIAIGGDEATASGYYSLALGIATSSGEYSVSLGNEVRMRGNDTYGFGKQIRSGISAMNNITVGFGSSSALDNDIDNCIMLGMNSTVPTMYLEDAGGYSGGIGRVGIGTTDPDGLLHLRDENGDDTELVIEQNGVAEANLRFNDGTTEAARIGINAFGGASSNHIFYENLTNNVDQIFRVTVNSSLTEAMRIDGTTGWVGIGAPVPAAPLNVRDEGVQGSENLAQFNVSDAGGDRLQIRNGTPNNGEFISEIFGDVSTHANEALRLTAATDIDTGTLPVMVFTSRVPGTPEPLAVQNRPIFQWRNNGARLMHMEANGNLGIGTTSPTGLLEPDEDDAIKPFGGDWDAPSDIQLKEDIEEFTDGLDVLLQFAPKRFRYNGTFGLPNSEFGVGVIAQEVREIAPYMVDTVTRVDSILGEADFLSYKGTALTYIIVNSIKELNNRIVNQDSLIQQIAFLSNELEDLQQVVNTCCHSKSLGQDENSELTNRNPLRNSEEGGVLRTDPNPFSDHARISFQVPKSVRSAMLKITDMKGIVIYEYPILKRGNGEMVLQGTQLSSGTYICTLILDNRVSQTKRLIKR